MIFNSKTIDVAVGDFIETSKVLEDLMDTLEVVANNMESCADNSPNLVAYRTVTTELQLKVAELSPLVDKILEDIEEL